MKIRKQKYLLKIITGVMVGVFLFFQFITIRHYQLFHSEEKKQNFWSENHHSESCFICHTQGEVFCFLGFSFDFFSKGKEIFLPIFDFENQGIVKKINFKIFSRGPPLDFE